MLNERPRLWLVSELYYPEQGTISHLLTQMAEGLADDFSVQVLCGQPDYFEPGQKAASRETRNGTTIHRVRGTRFGSGNLFSRIVDALTSTLSIFVFALFHFRKGDRVLAATNPPPLPVMIAMAAKLRGCQSSLLVHDVYPEVLAATEVLHEKSLIYRVLKAIFRRSYLMYDRFIVLGVCMRNVVQQKLGSAERPIAIIPNWADDDIVPTDRASNTFRKANGLADKFVVQFSGNFGRTHDLELLLDAARLLNDRPDIMFVFVGAGAKLNLAEGFDNGVANVMFLPRQPRELLCEMLNTSDVTVISFIDGMLGLSVPSRMYNVMAAGVPIIASAHPDSELVREIRAANSGFILEKADARELADLLQSLASPAQSADVRLKGANARQAVLDRYLAHQAIDLYRQALL